MTVLDLYHSGQPLAAINMNDLAKNEEFLKSAFKGKPGLIQS